MSCFSITGAIKNYAWGSRDYIKSLLSIESHGPLAEYWLGTHFLGEAKTEDGILLSEKIGHRLSFLFKVLAISTPLAIQCHPSKSQAQEGYLKESLLSLDDEERNYPDDSDKTEAVIALSDFTALYGFLPLEGIKENLSSFVPELFGKIKDSSSIKEVLETISNLSKEETSKILSQLEEKTGNTPPLSFTLGPRELCALCLSLYRDDIWCISPLLMNVVNLKANESLFIKPCIVHAYCRGNCLEIMSSSDNMTRLGLTKRHVDEKEFLKIAYLDSTPSLFLEAMETEEGAFSYSYKEAPFSLIRYEKGIHTLPRIKDGIIFSIEGKAILKIEDKEIEMGKGEAYYVGEDDKMMIEAQGSIFFAYGDCL